MALNDKPGDGAQVPQPGFLFLHPFCPDDSTALRYNFTMPQPATPLVIGIAGGSADPVNAPSAQNRSMSPDADFCGDAMPVSSHGLLKQVLFPLEA